MASAPDHDGDDMFDQFLTQRGHDQTSWEDEYNKKRCPECGGIHEQDAVECTVCGWRPGA